MFETRAEACIGAVHGTRGLVRGGTAYGTVREVYTEREGTFTAWPCIRTGGEMRGGAVFGTRAETVHLRGDKCAAGPSTEREDKCAGGAHI